jgi:hypothetical protein
MLHTLYQQQSPVSANSQRAQSDIEPSPCNTSTRTDFNYIKLSRYNIKEAKGKVVPVLN